MSKPATVPVRVTPSVAATRSAIWVLSHSSRVRPSRLSGSIVVTENPRSKSRPVSETVTSAIPMREVAVIGFGRSALSTTLIEIDGGLGREKGSADNGSASKRRSRVVLNLRSRSRALPAMSNTSLSNSRSGAIVWVTLIGMP